MARSVLLVIIGVIGGAMAVYVYRHNTAAISEPAPIEQAADMPTALGATAPTLPAIDLQDIRNATDNTDLRVAAYQRAVDAIDAFDVESMIEVAAAAPESRARELELRALIARLIEIDPARAVDFALSSYLETQYLLQTFRALLVADRAAAVQALQRVTPAARQYKIALAIAGMTGFDESAIEQIAAALPSDAAVGFALDSIIERASVDPASAFQTLLALDRSSLLSYALPMLAESMAASDPRGAMAMAESIDDYDLRLNFQRTLFGAWAQLDPDRVFEYLEALDPALMAASGGAFAALARSDSDRLLDLSAGFPPVARNEAERTAMQVLAEQDPVAALAMLEQMPPGQDRENMLQTIGRAYGQRNPDVALAWAKSLNPPSEAALRSVLQGIAAADVNRAIELFIAELDAAGSAGSAQASSIGSSLSLSMMLSLVSSNGGDVARLANRLIEMDNPQTRSMMALAISVWSSQDQEAALNWALNNADRIDPNVFTSVARNLTSDDPALALATMQRLPAEQRAGWFEGVVQQTASTDIDAARNMLENFRGQPGYDRAYRAVVQELARADPPAAARMLDEAPPGNVVANAVFMIAREWSSQDPRAAGQWALDLDNDQIRNNALSNIASTWAQRDADAAERWLFSMSSGTDRDAAVDGFLSTVATIGEFDPRLLEAYSDDGARQRGASRAIAQLGRTNPEEAARLLNLYVTDPALKAQTEEQLVRFGVSGGSVRIIDGNVVVLR